MYATPESVEDAPLPVPSQRLPSVDPPEYEVGPPVVRRSRRLQRLHPYVYVGPTRRSRRSLAVSPPVHDRTSGASNGVPACHPTSALDRLSIRPSAFDRGRDGRGAVGSGVSGADMDLSVAESEE